MAEHHTQYNDILEYAQSIIVRAPKFRVFAEAVMDFMEEVNAVVFTLYENVRKMGVPPEIELDSVSEVNSYSIADLRLWYDDFLKEQQKRDECDRQNVKESIDELQYLIEGYRSSERFKQMMDFVGRFRYLAPYNAILVQKQKPGATFVFTAKRWERDYLRRPKINAQQLITLVPFGPVQFMFDYSDTEPLPDTPEELVNRKVKQIEAYEDQFNKATGQMDDKEWNNLCENLPRYGILLDEGFNAANSYAGYLLTCKDRYVDLQLAKDCRVRTMSRFYISVNKNQKPEAKFVTICHELGHLFCRHLFYDREKVRVLSHKEEEFEAETVAWLVCKRHGITNPSEEYLAQYAPKGEIPICSLDTIMKAVTEIEKMLNGIVPIKKTLWYSNDKVFKNAIDVALKDYKQRSMVPNLFDGQI